ncbi:MAG: cysteine--tRNA ligase, partial [Acidimicrobiia bacterium]
MEVFSTLGRSRQELETRSPGEVAIYVCGPTVQSAPHVGHGRPAVAYDVIRRYLEWSGYRVTFVVNITDIDDKIIAAAGERGIPTEQLAADVADQFLRASGLLGVRDPDVLCYATEHIPEMLSLIERLIDRGHAYEAGGDVYFSVRSLPEYGKLSGKDIDELVAGARVEPGEHKHDPLDFAVWKAAKPGEPFWESPWGPGRPGWHIECSAMSEKYLGFGFDIHGGGQDLIFPHHENEVAQSEGATGDEPFVRYWLHSGLINLEGEKMSKSTGVVIDLLTLLDRHPPLAIRLFYLRTHYRSPAEFSEEALQDVAASLGRLWSFRRRITGAADAAPDEGSLKRFKSAMDDDFNTPEALAVLFDVVREGNRCLDEGEDAGPWVAAYDEIVAVLGLDEPDQTIDD